MIYFQGKFQCSEEAFTICIRNRTLYLGEGLHITNESGASRYFNTTFSSYTNENEKSKEPVLICIYPWQRLYKPLSLVSVNFQEVLPARHAYFEIKDFLTFTNYRNSIFA
jgi:hypothetical protein